MAETGKQLRSSGSSSDESDPAKDESAGTLKRSFECTYCKRGFTNAQALGGHMNIHRKDRAKGKQTTAAAKKGNLTYSDDPNSMVSYRQIAPIETGYANWDSQRMMMMMNNHQLYRPAAVSSGVLNLPAGGGYSEPVRPLGHHDLMGPNLSLRVGPAASNYNVAWNNNNNTEDDDNHEEGNNDNEDVDLELRLGPR